MNAQHIEKRLKINNGRDQDSDLAKHAVESRHLQVVKSNFTMLDERYASNTLKRKIARILMIKMF